MSLCISPREKRKVMANNRVSGSYFTCVRICESIFLQEQVNQSSERERERETETQGERERQRQRRPRLE